jgi:antitoxin ParD1/3/4
MEHEAKINALRAALLEGEESGPSTRFDFEAFVARKKRSVNR